MENFIKNFADLFDETDVAKFTPKTKFRDLEEWSSLTTLAVLNSIERKYGILLKFEEMQKASTIQELYDIVISKKK